MLLPVEIARFTRPKHRLVSVALIRALRQAAVSCYGALWSPDFPREQIVPAIVVANFAGAHCININQKQPQKKYKCYATAILSRPTKRLCHGVDTAKMSHRGCSYMSGCLTFSVKEN